MLTSIKRIYIKAFGKLKDFSMDFDKGANLILQDNGFGKTTICAFIKAMFYGFTYKVDGIDRDSKIYLPWDAQGSYGGTLEFVAGGKDYKIERYFTATAKGESVKLFDVSLNKEIDCDDIGETFLGLSSKAYESCFYIPQKDVELKQDESVVSKLTNMVNSADSDKAIAELDNFVKHLSNPQRKDAVIPNLQKEKADLERRLAKALNSFEQSEKAKKSMEESAKKVCEIQAKIKDVSSKLDECRKTEQTEEITRTSDLMYNISVLRAQLEPLSAFKDASGDCQIVSTQPLQKEVQKAKTPLLCGCGASLVLAIVFALLQQFVVFGILGVLAIAFLVLAFVIKTKMANPLVKEILSKYFVVDDNSNLEILVKQLCENTEKYIQLNSQLQGFLARVNQTKTPLQEQVKLEKNRLEKEFEILQHELSSHQANVNLQKGRIELLLQHEDSTFLKEQIAQIQQEIEKQTRLCHCAKTAMENIILAKENLATSYLPKLAQKASEILSSITNGKYSQIVTDKEFNLALVEQGMQKEIGRFSKGIQQQTLFAFRLALSISLYQKEIPFVLIDDGFVDLDETCFANVMNFVKTLAQNCQVIYFTCHKRGEILKN